MPGTTAGWDAVKVRVAEIGTITLVMRSLHGRRRKRSTATPRRTPLRGDNFDPALFYAWYSSVISSQVSQDRADEANAWVFRVIARYDDFAAAADTPFRGMLDPIRPRRF